MVAIGAAFVYIHTLFSVYCPFVQDLGDLYLPWDPYTWDPDGCGILSPGTDIVKSED